MMSTYAMAVNGLNNAADRFTRAASQQVVNSLATSSSFAGSQGYQQPISSSPANLAITSFPPQGTPLYTPSYAEDILTLRQATAAYKANIEVFKGIDETANTALKLLR